MHYLLIRHIEVFEKEDEFVVKAELLGMKEEDIDVSVVGDILTVKGDEYDNRTG